MKCLAVLVPCFLLVSFSLLMPLAADASEVTEWRLGSPDYQSLRWPSERGNELGELGVQPRRVVDYGTFQWLELEAGVVESLQSAGRLENVTIADYRLTLGERTFDPLLGSPLEAPEWQPVASANRGLHLVQLVGPTRGEWLQELEAAQLEVVQYIHPFTYVVWGDLAAARVHRAADFIRWAGPFAPAYRVLPQWRAALEERGTGHYSLLAVRYADRSSLLAQLSRLGAEAVEGAVLDHRFESFTLQLPKANLAAAARLSGVYSIQPVPTDGGLRSELSNQINVGNVGADNLAFPGYQAWLTTAGLDGSGVTIANVDSGIQDTHPDLVGRMLGCTGTTCGTGSSGHGTHTAGIMAADGSSGTTDSNGFLRGLGVAPGANLIEQNYFPFFTQAGGMLLLMSDSHANGAQFSGNSWGPAGTPRGYDNDTMQVDMGVRDVDSTTAGNQAFTYVLSFMNGNGGTSSQGSPDEAKNLFNIGSTKARFGGGNPDPNINDLSANTAHGPALDGRTIPHMVAPGCWVDSTLPTDSHGVDCGTSMASPAVSGGVALFFEYFRGLFASDPSPALVKAAFLPVAINLEGNRDADGGILGHRFDSKQGWGRMDLAAVVTPEQEVAYFDDPQVFDNTGESWERVVQVDDPSEPVRIMLVWTDAPGHGMGGSTPAWNNDLDLEVVAGAMTYRGNVFGADGWSTTGGTADDRNNTEGVILPGPVSGSLTLRVLASDINSDAIPNTGDATDQDFALVCYNCRGSATDIFNDDFEDGTMDAWASSTP